MKVYFTRFLFFGLLASWLVSYGCNDKSEAPKARLALDETSLPQEELLGKGGAFSIIVDWANVRFRVVPGEVKQGTSFVMASEELFGSLDEGPVQSEIVINYLANEGQSKNVQEVSLVSMDGKFRLPFLVSQAVFGASEEDYLLDLKMDPGRFHQTITGFGGANMMWGTDYLTTSEMQLAFDADEGLGLSIFRVRLPSVKSQWQGLVRVIKDANALGVKVLATPWSPPAAWKTNNSTNGGGSLLPEHYGDFAEYINEYITFMRENGATIDVVSIQNEPDYEVDYEGCEYTVEEMFDFVKNHAGKIISGAQVVAAESFHFNHDYTDAILDDPVAADNIDIVGFHTYGSGRTPYPLAQEKGKELWMTEHLYNLNSGNNPENWTANTSQEEIWEETMTMLRDIHEGMTYNWNAYIWWYTRRFYSFLGDGDNGTERGTVLKRGYAMSQYSKFIRPGYRRIDAGFEGAPSTVLATAYEGPDKTVAVILNTGEEDQYRSRVVLPSGKTTATAYTTSLDQNRAEIEVDISDGKVFVPLSAKSITTIVFE